MTLLFPVKFIGLTYCETGVQTPRLDVLDDNGHSLDMHMEPTELYVQPCQVTLQFRRTSSAENLVVFIQTAIGVGRLQSYFTSSDMFTSIVCIVSHPLS